jgi:rod shape-determining protein MreB
MAGNAMDQAIEEHFRAHHFFAIGETTAERIKIQHGSAVSIDPYALVDVKGLNVRTGCPAVLRVPAGEIHEALEPILVHIVEAIRRTIEYLPPELAGDILTEGGAMVGGGALLRGWAGRLQEALGRGSHPQLRVSARPGRLTRIRFSSSRSFSARRARRSSEST